MVEKVQVASDCWKPGKVLFDLHLKKIKNNKKKKPDSFPYQNMVIVQNEMSMSMKFCSERKLGKKYNILVTFKCSILTFRNRLF